MVRLETSVREVLGSNLARNTAFLSDAFRGFPQSASGKCQFTTWIRPRPLPSECFSIQYSPIILPFDDTVLVDDSAVNH
jgi:hypothetical protein